MDVANIGLRIPYEHGVGSFGTLGIAGLVDADCVTRTELSGVVCPTVIPLQTDSSLQNVHGSYISLTVHSGEVSASTGTGKAYCR